MRTENIKTVSASEILKAGGADKFAKTKGKDTSRIRLSGRIRLSKEETLRALTMLNE